MKNVSLFLLSFLCVVAAMLFIYQDDIRKTQDDFQAYSEKSLLPEDYE